MSRFLNADTSDVRFWLRCYELARDYWEHPRFPGESDPVNSVFIKGIASLEDREREPANYLDDLSVLGLHCDNPV